MKPIRVSVIIPNYNRASLVGETIENILRQTLPPHEVIVVDDGSTDNSIEVIKSFGKRVRLIQQANRGPGAARNAGLEAVTGEYIQFQDSDDLFSLNKLEAQTKLLEQSGADIASSPWAKVRIEGQQLFFEDHVLQQKMPPAGLNLPHWCLRGWSTVFQSLLFRRSFLNQIGCYRTDLMPSEDTELFFRILTSSPRVAFTAEPLMLYRLHTTNKITQDGGTSQTRRVMDWAQCLRYIIERRENYGLKLDWMTRSIFLVGIQKHLCYLRAVPDCPAELIEYLSKRVAEIPSAWLAGVKWWQRFAEQWRLRSRGSRWMDGYQAEPPSDHQLRLIEELGFEIGGAAHNLLQESRPVGKRHQDDGH
jgi:glycosyltransferase involved in cell wall biosynthesis